MKASTINKKWILTASLLTVLCGHYSYQTSSITLSKAHAQTQNSGEYVLASTDDRRPAQQTETRPQRPKKTETTTTVPEAPTTKTESGTTCTEGCETKPADAQAEFLKIITRLEALEKAQKESAASTADKPATPAASPSPSPSPSPAPAPTVPSKEETSSEVDTEMDCEAASETETRSEKRIRLACEKKEKKRIKQEQKEEIEKLKKEEREEKFLDRVEALKDKCEEELECLTSGFTSILSRFDGKKAISAKLVNAQFTSTVQSALNKALYSDDPQAFEASMLAIQSLIQNMPEQYRVLRQTVMTAVSAKTSIASNQAKASFAKASEAAKANNPQAYFEALSTAQQEQQTLTLKTNYYLSSISNSLETVGDTNLLSYYQKNYVPDMQKIINSIQNNVAAPTTATTTTRDNRTMTINTSGTSAPSVTTTVTADKMTTNDRWLTPTNNGTVIFDPARPASSTTRGGRAIPQ